MKNTPTYRKQAVPGFLKLTLATMAALPLASSLQAGSPVVPIPDWVQSGPSSDWFLSTPLVGDSVSAYSTGFAALEVDGGVDAAILDGASWTGLQLEDPLVVAFEQYGALALGGDLTASTDYEDLEEAFLSGGVGFFNGGSLSGTGNITITSNSATSVAPLVLAGVYSNNLSIAPSDAIEGDEPSFEDGTLDITNYTGEITVVNDNSVGSAAVSETESIPLPIELELDPSKSAVAVGIAAVEAEDGLNLGTIYGAVQQKVTTTAKSRDAEYVQALPDEEQEPGFEPALSAVTAAVAVGVLGELEDGIASTADIQTTAVSGTSVTQTAEEYDDAFSLNIGLAVGVGGIVADIEDGATITTSASSASSQAASNDGDATSNNVALAAGVIGFVGDEEEYALADAPVIATTTITTTAVSASSTATAEEFAEAASGALAIGVGGSTEGLSNTVLNSTATSGVVIADSGDYSSLGLSVTGAIGVVGLVDGDLDHTAITSTATSSTATVTGEYIAGASSLAVAGGIMGEIAPETADLALNATANAGVASATAYDYASADASALAFGVSSSEIIYFVGETLSPIIAGSGSLPNDLDFISGDLLSGFALSDAIEAVEPVAIEAPFSYTINGEVVANAADATATLEGGEMADDEPEADSSSYAAYASASAAAVGFDSPVGFSDYFVDDPIESDGPSSLSSVDGALSVTANAGTADASGFASSESVADAFALGFDEINADVAATITVKADAGTATSEYGFMADESSEASAVADALGIDSLNGNLESTASVVVDALGGTASVSEKDSPFPDMYRPESYTSAHAIAGSSATGIARTNRFLSRFDEVEADGYIGYSEISGLVDVTATSESATAEASIDAYAQADARATGVGSFDNYDSITANLTGIIDVDASAGSAEASAHDDATADANTYATAVVTGDEHFGEIGGTITADAVGGAADTSSNGVSSANAYTEAVGVYVRSEEIWAEGDEYNEANASIRGNVSASITVNANADVATARSEYEYSTDLIKDPIEGADIGGTLVEAYADAVAIGIANVDTVYGDVSGPITANSVGGSALATANAVEVFSEFEQIMIAEPLSDYEVAADASSESIGVEGSIDGVLSSTIVLNAGATESSTPIAEALNDLGGIAEADASAETTGVAGDVYGYSLVDLDGPVATISGRFEQNATGGVAVARVNTFEFLEEPIMIDTDSIEAGEAYEPTYTVSADASADSFGVDGSVYGDAEADFAIVATAGRALATSDGVYDSHQALAYGDAAGIYGSVLGDYNASMSVSATGGDAYIDDTSSIFDIIDGDFPVLFDVDFADASAIATGIGGESALAIEGDIAGTIEVTATGGTAALFSEYGAPIQLPNDSIEGDPEPIEEFDGLYVRESAYNAYAQAVGINGDTISETVSAAITATAVGGEVYIEGYGYDQDSVEASQVVVRFDPDYSAGAFAAGIAGESVAIEAVTGDITATAVAGVVTSGDYYNMPVDSIESDSEVAGFPEIGFAFPYDSGFAFAAGMMTYTPAMDYYGPDDAIESLDSAIGNSIDVTIASTINAVAIGGFFGEPTDAIEAVPYMTDYNPYAYAAAVYGAQGDDDVELADGANIIGDINLGGGANFLAVIGNTIMEGNILSTAHGAVDYLLNIDNGMGTVDFDIDSGFFTAVRTVNVSDLADTLSIESTGGLAPILSQNPFDGDTSLVDVDYGNNGYAANVELASGATVLPVFADSVDLNAVVGNEYIIASAEGGVVDNGGFVDNSDTPFEYILEVRESSIVTDAIEGIDSVAVGPADEDLVLIVDRVKEQDEEETPGTVQTNQAVNAASQAVLIDISKHAALLRTLLRRNAQGAAPAGPSGPDAEKMEKGEWLSYISVFGNIGEQESSGGFAGFEYDTYGMVVGQEKLIGDQLIVGIAGGYAETDIDGLDGSGSGNSDLYSMVAYANWFTESWYVEGGLTYAYAESDTSRIDFKDDVYTGDYDSQLFGGWLEVGFTTEFEGFGLEPYARATFIHGEHDGFTDKGGDALVLTTEDSETDNFKTELGLRVNHSWALKNEQSFLVEVKAAWQREWGDEGVVIDSSYLGDDTLTLDSAEADEDAIVLGLRGEWNNGKGLSLGLEYEPTISGNWFNHAFSGTVQYNW